MKPLDLSTNALWKKRFRAARIAWASPAANNPDHVLVCSNQSGALQLYGWHIPSNRLTQLTHRANGYSNGTISANGRFVYYLDDAQGDELGHYMRIPFEGGDPEDLTPTLPRYASWGCHESHDGQTIGFIAASQTGFQLYTMSAEGSEPQPLWHTTALSFGPTFSANGEQSAITTTLHSGSLDTSLIVINGRSGETLAELVEPEASLSAVQFSPIAGDQRLLATSNASGYTRPFIWDLASNSVEPLHLPDLDGELYAWDWSENGRYLLLAQLNQAVHQLYAYDLDSHTLIKLNHPAGTLSGGTFRPDGTLFVNWQDATHPATLLALAANGQAIGTILSAGDVPNGHNWRSITFPTSDGSPIQAWVATPSGDGPFPTILHTHGGPTAVMTNVFHAEAQAWLDHGFAFLSVNYRGSTTFGKAFEKAIWGQLGNLEIDDMAAARDWAIANNIAQPDAILLTGGSYGGYLTLQALGRRPELWAGGMAGVAIADWALMYEDQAETLRGYQRALFGGTPDEKPEAHRDSSPITYAASLQAPILVIQGSNDTRCPARQMQLYEQTLNELGKQIQVHWFDAGHGSYQNEQQIEHQELKMRFAYQVLG